VDYHAEINKNYGVTIKIKIMPGINGIILITSALFQYDSIFANQVYLITSY